jgi:hypothetical protein
MLEKTSSRGEMLHKSAPYAVGLVGVGIALDCIRLVPNDFLN